MTLLRAKLLGSCDCRTAAGEGVVFPTRKTRALFAFLVSMAGQAQSRERLSGLLWGNQSEAQARTNLRGTLSRLRSALPAEARPLIVTESGGIAISADGLEVDTALFHHCLSSATPDSLERAVVLYRGAFLQGLENLGEDFDEWLLTERRQLEESFQQALQQLLDHYIVTGAIDRGIQTALRLVHLDPLQETLHRSLIRLYLNQDRVGAALAQYHQCRKLLSEELGVAPDPETERLQAEILKKLPASESGGPDSLEVERGALPEHSGTFGATVSLRERQRGAATGLPSIAVLAFRGQAAEGAPRHVTDGLAEDIAIELGRFRELEVISPASTLAYRDAPVSPEQIGRELGASYVLSGSLRIRDKALRISVGLLDAKSAEQIWAERFDCMLDTLFAAQDELIQRIVTSLVGRIKDASLKAARRKRPSEWAPYDLWLRGWDRLKQPDLKAIKEAHEYFDQAISADPHFARPYVGKAIAHLNEWACFSWNHWYFLKKDALEMARTAVRLDDHDNRAQCVLGIAQVYAGDYGQAKKHFSNALDLNPNDCDVLANAACAFALIGESDAAVAAGRKAIRLAPHHPDWYVAMVGLALYAARHYEEAVEIISTAPEAVCSTPAVLAAAYAQLGEPERGAGYKDTVIRYFRRMVARGDYPSNKSCVDWLMDLDPFQRPDDAAHYEDGLRKAGFE